MLYNNRPVRLERTTLSRGGTGINIVTKRKGKLIASICADDVVRMPDNIGFVKPVCDMERFIEKYGLGEPRYDIIGEPKYIPYQFNLDRVAMYSRKVS